MILVDDRAGSGHGVGDLVPLIKRLGVQADRTRLTYGDACFEGKGPTGSILVGIERKTLYDMLNCIDDARYNQQRIGMKEMYRASILMVEGMWREGRPPYYDGMLLTQKGDGKWFPLRNPNKVMYSKLYRYLASVMLSGVSVVYSDDLAETAYQIVEWWHYFQKPWDQHTALLQTQRLAIPSMTTKPSLAREFAALLPGIGAKLSREAELRFKTTARMVEANVPEWMQIPGVGPKTAARIVDAIQGNKKKV